MASNPYVRLSRRCIHCDFDRAQKPHPLNHKLKNEMKTTLSTYQAAEMLFNDTNANWTRAGAFALVEHLEELEEDIGEEIEFCPVALRCDYSQYCSLEAWANEQWRLSFDGVDALGLTIGDDGKIEESPEDIDDAIRDYIQERGTLLEFSDGVIVSSF